MAALKPTARGIATRAPGKTVKAPGMSVKAPVTQVMVRSAAKSTAKAAM